jgi:hypothetical protein
MRAAAAFGWAFVCSLCHALSATARHDAHDSIASLRHRADMIKQAQTRIASRNAFLSASFPHERAGFASATMHSTAAVALLAPYYACPYELTRSNLVSDEFEGGKWVCGAVRVPSAPAALAFRTCELWWMARRVRWRGACVVCCAAALLPRADSARA